MLKYHLFVLFVFVIIASIGCRVTPNGHVKPFQWAFVRYRRVSDYNSDLFWITLYGHDVFSVVYFKIYDFVNN